MTHEQRTFEDYCKRNGISIIKKTNGRYHMRTTQAAYEFWKEAYKAGYELYLDDVERIEDYW